MIVGAAGAAAFMASIVAANWLTTTFGFVPVGFGLTATAGTYAAGAALVLRDLVQERLGWRGAVLAVLAACALSAVLADPAIAVASATAFVVSEIADMAVYTPLRTRHWRTAIIGSSIVGAIVDTALFIGIAFGWAALTPAVLAGQLVGKVLWVAVPVAIAGGALQSRRRLSTT